MDFSGNKGDWPVEDDCDALNDETFGDDGGAEFNWEDAQVSLDDFEKAKPNGNSIHHESRSGESLSNSNDSRFPAFGHQYEKEDSKPDFDDDFDNENALEESISRLVMDDLDDEDEEEARKSKLRRLGTATNFNTYFMPPQVASKHLQWFMDKELPGGSSLLGSSVWSMHPTTTVKPAEPPQPPVVVHQQQVPVTHQPPPHAHFDPTNSHFLNQLTGQGRSDLTARLPDSLKDNITLNLQSMMGPKSTNSSVQSPSSSSMPNKKPIFKTVEEIERELLEGSPAAEEPKVSNAKQHNLTSGGTSTSTRPKVMTAEELEKELMEPSTPTSSSQSQIPLHDLPLTPTSMMHPQINQGIPSPDQMLRHPGSPSFPQSIGGNAAGVRPPPGMNMNMNQMMMQRMAHPQFMNAAPFGQRMGGVPPHHQIPPNVAAQIAFQQQQQHLRMLHMNPHLRGRMILPMPFPPHMGPHMRPGFPMHPGNHHMNHSSNSGFIRKSDDPYSGLMNEKDKKRLKNIQIIQLQNDHPYTTDYYCLMYKVRHGHGSNDSKRQRDCLAKLFPKALDDPSAKNNYQPAHFENSLGKLQAVSALAPKKAIDTVIRVVDSGPCNRSGIKAYRYLLLEVEKLYECLMRIQEADIRKTLLSYTDQSILVMRRENTEKVVKFLMSPEKLSEILRIHKGKMLVSRLIPLMEPSVRYLVFAHMIRNFPAWAMVHDPDIEKTYPFLRHCILATEMTELLAIINNKVNSKVFECMAISKLGISLLLAAFHRAEIIFSNPTDVLLIEEKNFVQSWISNSTIVLLSIVAVANEVAIPIEMSPHILQHVRRFRLPPEENLVFESIVRKWAEISIPLM